MVSSDVVVPIHVRIAITVAIIACHVSGYRSVKNARHLSQLIRLLSNYFHKSFIGQNLI